MSILTNEYTYPFDPTGKATTNRVSNEVHVITQQNHKDYSFVIPNFAPFFAEGLSIIFTDVSGNPVPLVEGQDYYFGHHFLAASRAVGKQIYGSISFITKDFKGVMRLDYQTIGGKWTYDQAYLTQLMTNIVSNPRTSTWDSVVELPALFPVIDHEWDLADMVGMSHVVAGLYGIEEAIRDPEGTGTGGGSGSQLMNHILDRTNPHAVTKLQVGLGNVQNYGAADQAAAESGAADNLYMTPLTVKQAIAAQALSPLNTHTARTDNPHATTKAQVGLGSVQNYAVADQAAAEAGTSNALYMTPLSVAQAIAAQALVPLNTHVARTDNPHNTTAAQVGLGNVQNYAVADKTAAEAGTANNLYMTPLSVKQAIAAIATTGLTAHINDISNPHNVNKNQVGLGNVQNFAVATTDEAVAGTSSSTYMTPALVTAVINAKVGPGAAEHLTNYNNPHGTTAAQVGAYTSAQTDTLLSNKLDKTGTATNSSKFEGKTLAEATAQILLGKTASSANSDALAGHSYEDLLSIIGASTVANANKLENKSLSQVLSMAAAQDANNALKFGGLDIDAFYASIGQSADVTQQKSFERVNAIAGATNLWTQLFTVSNAIADEAHVLVEGGNASGESDGYLYLVKVHPGSGEVRVFNWTGVNSTLQFGSVTRVENGITLFDVWVKSSTERLSITMTELSDSVINLPSVALRDFNLSGVMVPENVVATAPSGIQYIIETNISKQLWDHLANTANPHGTTKAQVGLGNVGNYAVATQAVAEAGTDNATYMTPLRVAQAITALVAGTSVGTSLTSHIANTSNPHSVTKAQVGLGNVGNYSVATQATAEAGTDNATYMTPLRVAQAISVQALTPLTTHTNRTDNPHSVTKAQVGLGNVDNYASATTAEAQAGTATDKFMTAARVKEAIVQFATKAQVGLSNVQNYAIATQAVAEAGTDNATYMTPLRVAQAVNVQAIGPLNTHTARTDNPHSVTKAQVGLANVENFATATQADILAGMTRFKDIFDTWYRYSHNGATQPASTTELNNWVYDDTIDSIKSTVNSATHIGIVSTVEYSDYDFQVEVSSTNSDDDRIGIVLGFETINGVEYTLTASRQLDSVTNTFTANYNVGLTGARVIAANMGGMASNPYINSASGTGWVGVKFRLRAVRSGNIITVYTTPPNSTVFDEASKIVIDLNANADTQKFMTSSKIGFYCQSQIDATWDLITTPWARNDLFMTPLRVREALDTLAVDPLNSRINTTNSQVTTLMTDLTTLFNALTV